MRDGQPRSLTAAQQFLNLRINPICAGTGTLHAGRLVWRYRVSPTPLSREYDVRIDYRQDDIPTVFVDKPDLAALAVGRRLPHVYEQKPTRLCLYLPRAREWATWMRIDLTIVPWVALWLFYFEEWLGSDQWKGGGEHPSESKARRSTRRSSRGLAIETPTVIDSGADPMGATT
jgi:hypothetical protein